MLADRDRAREGNLAHHVLGDEVFRNRRRHAEHQIEHPRGQPGIGEATHHFDARARRLFGRLDDDRAAGRQGAADLARRRQCREVPWREGGDDTDRLLHDQLADLAAARHDAAVGAAALFRIPLDDIGRGHHLGAGLGEHLALFLHQGLADGVVPLADQVRRLAHDFRAVIGGRRAPYRKALFGGFQRLVEIGRAGMRQLREWLLGCRIDHILAAATVAVEPLAVDEKSEIGVHAKPLEVSRENRCAIARGIRRCARPVSWSWAVFAGPVL